MQAAIGCAQLDKFPSFVERRRHNFDRLKAGLEGTEKQLILPEACPHSRPSWFGFLITCREGVERNKVVQYVEKKGVQTRMLFAGNLTKHPCFDEMRQQARDTVLWAAWTTRTALWPTHSGWVCIRE